MCYRFAATLAHLLRTRFLDSLNFNSREHEHRRFIQLCIEIIRLSLLPLSIHCFVRGWIFFHLSKHSRLPCFNRRLNFGQPRQNKKTSSLCREFGNRNIMRRTRKEDRDAKDTEKLYAIVQIARTFIRTWKLPTNIYRTFTVNIFYCKDHGVKKVIEITSHEEIKC